MAGKQFINDSAFKKFNCETTVIDVTRWLKLTR